MSQNSNQSSRPQRCNKGISSQSRYLDDEILIKEAKLYTWVFYCKHDEHAFTLTYNSVLWPSYLNLEAKLMLKEKEHVSFTTSGDKTFTASLVTKIVNNRVKEATEVVRNKVQAADRSLVDITFELVPLSKLQFLDCIIDK